jgi:aspartyl-tRNA(Asn)/glutamyl-tRNA(Gln) amidotransferase subunit C
LSLDIETVRTISLLARLRVPDDEMAALAHELSDILDWVEQLAGVDTTDIEPMTSVVAMVLPWRSDEVTDGNRLQAVLANAPGGIDDCFTVPKVVE